MNKFPKSNNNTGNRKVPITEPVLWQCHPFYSAGTLSHLSMGDYAGSLINLMTQICYFISMRYFSGSYASTDQALHINQLALPVEMPLAYLNQDPTHLTETEERVRTKPNKFGTEPFIFSESTARQEEIADAVLQTRQGVLELFLLTPTFFITGI